MTPLIKGLKIEVNTKFEYKLPKYKYFDTEKGDTVIIKVSVGSDDKTTSQSYKFDNKNQEIIFFPSLGKNGKKNTKIGQHQLSIVLLELTTGL